MDTIQILNILLIVIVILIFVLGIVAIVIILNMRRKQIEAEQQLIKDKNQTVANNPNLITRTGKEMNSIYKFIEFDEIKDNMIIRRNRSQFVMVLQCQGINYDLLSEEEKYAVENGFIEFLNTLRFPIQLYVQTRKLDLTELLNSYGKRTNAIKDQIARINSQIMRAKDGGNRELVEKLEFDKRRRQNILEYGESIEEYTERMNENKNMLHQKTYLILSYFTSELGDSSKYNAEEINDLVFSELYTRAQTVIRAIGSAEVTAKVLNSEELAELLYVAYNRDEAETYTLANALNAEYDRLYSTGKDTFEERKKRIEQQVEEQAANLASQSLIKADKDLREEKARRAQQIRNRAQEMVSTYKEEMSAPLYAKTMNNINNAKFDENGKIVTPVQPVANNQVATNK